MNAEKIIEALDDLSAGELVEVVVAAAQELERRVPPRGQPRPSPEHGGGGGP